jgi:hypothetical protein
MSETATQTSSDTNKTAIVAFAASLAGLAGLAVFVGTMFLGEHARGDQWHAVATTAFWVLPAGALLAVVLGHVAWSQTKRSGQTGRGLAMASLIIGYLAALSFVVLVVLTVLVIQAFTHVI